MKWLTHVCCQGQQDQVGKDKKKEIFISTIIIDHRETLYHSVQMGYSICTDMVEGTFHFCLFIRSQPFSSTRGRAAW